MLPLGIEGDEQADLSVHGGLGKAVYAYPSEHYAFWKTVRAQAQVALWDEELPFGAMGENLTLQGVAENELWIGDVLRFPACQLAVSEPRFPCFKFNAAMGFKHAAKLMVESAWCGAYLAVRVPGTIAAGQTFTRGARAARGRHHRAVPRPDEPRRRGLLMHDPHALCVRCRPAGAISALRAAGRALMLAYRHAFHAGNHADVLKHIVLMLVLRHMNAKPKPYRYVDTHGGAGGYSLEGRYAQKKGEYERGIGRLWTRTDLPEAVADYVALVRRFNPDGVLAQYPGSPALAQMLLRPQDQLRAFELHPTEQKILRATLAATPGAIAYDGDGFAGLKSQLPPSSRRAAVLIDPSYEGNADYGRVVATLREALARFAPGVYMVWYPQVSKLEAASLPKRLEALAPKGWLHARLSVQQPDAQGFGLAGSGMFVINPPHALAAQLQAVLPWLVDVLGQYDGAHFALDRLEA